MQSENRFLNFAEQIIASHRGFGYGYEPAAMLYLEDTMQEGQEQIPPSQSFVTKLYQIQNIKEENYLYRQNLSFLTQILEKRLYQNLYPSVETQIEKVVREEMPNVGTEVVKSFSQHLCRLVEQGGIEQFERIRDRILSEYQTNEKTTWKEQEILFRKIENIWNSSVYSRTDNHLENNTYRNAVSVDQTWEEQNQTILERTMAVMQRQEQLLMAAKPQGIGNLGRTYESVVMTANPGHTYEPVVMTANPPAVLEYAAESRFTETEQEILERQFQEKQLLEQQLLQETKLTESLTEQLTERIREKESQKTHNRTTERLERETNLQSTEHILTPEIRDVTQNVIQNITPVHQDYLNLEYPTEESSQNHGESSQNHEKIVQVLQTESERTLEREHEEQIHEKVLQQQTQLVSQISEHIITPETLLSMSQNDSQSNIQSLSQELVQNVVQDLTRNETQNFSPVHQDYLNLEYPTEESSQIHQEIMQILQTELERIPEVPQAAASETVSQQQVLLARKSKNLAEQMILRMETSGIVPKAQTVSAAKTVALQQLSQAILEYADSHTTTEELTSSVVHILKGYQNESVRELPTESYYSESIRRLPSESSVVRKLIKQQLQITEPVQNLETASIVYRSEEASAKSQDRTIQLEKQINEVVKNLKTVEEKTIVHKEKIIEEQKNVVHEVLRSNPQVWTEGEGANFIRKEVRQSMDEQLTQNVNQIVSKVYRRLEDKLRTERGRRGLI